MESLVSSSTTISLLCILFAACFLLLSRLSKNGTRHRPPSPPGWPIIGNIFDLGTLPHQTLYELRPKYGPIIWLKLCSVNTMVVQSAKTAAELFKNHDLAFCDRKCPHSLTALGYNLSSLSMNNYGPYWRQLRRLYATELLGNVGERAPVRRKCMDDMVRFIEEDSAAAVAKGESGEVCLSHFLAIMAFNLVGNLALSRDLLDSRSPEGLEFFESFEKVVEGSVKPNVADLMPFRFLKWLDPQGLKRDMERDMGRTLKIANGFIREKLEEQKVSGKERTGKKDFLDVLLEHKRQGSQLITNHSIAITIMEMFFGGSETTSGSVEWAMAELFHNPETMKIVKEELDRVVGQHNKVEEIDIDQLPYLQAVLKETLRLHPPVPFLLPRNTIQDTNYMGYMIPKDTQVLVNVWAIGRDPDCWEDPLRFKPERFLGSNSNIDYKGQNYELIPFGAGRRICVGMSLGHKLLHLALATLLHSFDWELENGVSPETIDMNDKSGMTARKLIPLKAIPKKRIIPN